MKREMGWWIDNEKEYEINDRVITPHGKGTVVIIEACDSSFNSVSHDNPNAVDWRYGIKHDIQPTGFNYSPLYYYSREIGKE